MSDVVPSTVQDSCPQDATTGSVATNDGAIDKIGYIPRCVFDKIRPGCFHVREG